MRVFVAGATGAIGKQLVPRLAEAGHEVYGMTRSESKRAMLDELGAVPVVADALDPDQVATAVGRSQPEVIVHQLTSLAGWGMRDLKRGAAIVIGSGLYVWWRETRRAAGRLAVYPIVAGVLFSANSRWTTGTWFVPEGFYVPENEALGKPWLALGQVSESVLQLSGTAWVWPACLAAFTPLGESSKTSAAPFGTPSRSSAVRNRSGFGLVRPTPTSSAQMTLSK